ncbi:sugar phosphate isomerase/epimerase [soil metagenome]
MTTESTRRQFLRSLALAASATALPGTRLARAQDSDNLFDISLAEWSLHNTIFKGELDALDFPAFSKIECDISAVEYVNQMFKDKAKDEKWLGELHKRCDDHGVTSVLIMCDGEGKLGDPDETKRAQAVENHRKWLEAAKFLGCHSIRVNAASDGSYEEQQKLAADGLSSLSDIAAPLDLNVIVENHGGLSSNGEWLASVIKMTGKPNCGTLPDFGNFHDYDRYKGTAELMPYAKGVSAKSHQFNEDGEETNTDYRKMMKIVLDAGYRGYVGVEYEGKDLPEKEGILATKALLEKVRAELS